MKIKYLLSDLDGVIRKFPSERDEVIEKKYKLPFGTLFKTAFNKSNLDKVVCGLITDEVWRLEIEKSLAQICGETTAKMAIEEWSSFSGIVDQDYLNFLDQYFPKVPVVILTNGTTRLLSDLIKLGINSRFFKIFNSAEIGFAKPDRNIFEHILQDLSCEPSEILFVDDSLSHIKAAQDLCMRVHHYKSLSEFKDFLSNESLH